MPFRRVDAGESVGLRVGYIVFDPGEPLENLRERVGERGGRLRVLSEWLVPRLLNFDQRVLVVKATDDKVRTVDLGELLTVHD